MGVERGQQAAVWARDHGVVADDRGQRVGRGERQVRGVPHGDRAIGRDRLQLAVGRELETAEPRRGSQGICRVPGIPTRRGASEASMSVTTARDAFRTKSRPSGRNLAKVKMPNRSTGSTTSWPVRQSTTCTRLSAKSVTARRVASASKAMIGPGLRTDVAAIVVAAPVSRSVTRAVLVVVGRGLDRRHVASFTTDRAERAGHGGDRRTRPCVDDDARIPSRVRIDVAVSDEQARAVPGDVEEDRDVPG